MSLKNCPLSLFNLCLQKVAKALLQQWRDSYYTNFAVYSEELRSNICVTIPFTIYDQIFALMVDTHARVIQNDSNGNLPSVSALIDCIIVPSLRKLNLNCLRNMGAVRDEEIKYLESILTNELPNLNNLVEISLQTSGTDFTLPICNDEILEKIGSSCLNLKSLDISYNHTVTDKGLECLLPSNTQKGCVHLVKLSVFECSVTSRGVAVLLERLPQMQFLGYRETGQSLCYLNSNLLSGSVKQLELVHINNLGTSSRTCKDLYKLKCDYFMSNVICNLCPNLNGLKVRLDDLEVKFLEKMSTISILELVYNVGSPSSPSSNTIRYLEVCGAQFISLSFMCDMFSTTFLKVISEQCNNLRRLWIRCNRFNCDKDLTNSDKKKSVLTDLKVFYIRISSSEYELCNVPYSVFVYVLHKSCVLKEVTIAMKNSLICDSYIQTLFSSIQTSMLKHVMIVVPHKNVTVSSINLSMVTIESLIGMCPQLERLGNLLVWDVSLEEVEVLRRQLKLSNCSLMLVYKMLCL